MVTWGTAAGPFIVDGDDGAFGWVYRDFNGEVRSANGDAGLIVYGDAVGSQMVATAGRDTALCVVGDAHGGAEADQDLLVFALGNVWGMYEADRDATVST